MGNTTRKRARVLSAAGLCAGLVLGSGCGGGETPPPGVDYGATASQRLYTEPLLPATTAVPVDPTAVPPSGAPTGGGPTDPGAGGLPSNPPIGSGAAGSAADGVLPAAGAGPSVGTAGMDGTAMPGAAGSGASADPGTAMPDVGGARPTMLSLQFTTVTQGGRYAPDNIGAAWVETSAGKWIHTLEFWANVPNGSHLNRYSGAGGPDYGTFFGIPVTMPPADVVTSATLKQHKSHTGLSWNLKDASGAALADGDYKAVIELTEATSPGKFLEIPFTIGASAASPTPPTSQFYTGVQLTLQ